MNARVLSAAVVVLVLCAAALAVEPTVTSQPTSRPKITLGYDTTRITAPLRADGTVDYLAALNQAHSKGVTPANNAAIKLVEAIGPDLFPDSIRDEALKQLGVTLPADGEYYDPASDDSAAYDQALENPWQAGEHPALAAWLEKNKAPLARFLEASQRPRYYVPMLVDSESDFPGMISCLLPQMSAYRGLAKAMVIRANLAVAEGQPMDAWRDLLAAHRMGRLMEQDPALLLRLVSIAVCALADTATQAMLASGTLTADQAKQVLKDLSALSPAPTVASSIDEAERYCMLDSLATIAMQPGTIDTFLTLASYGTRQSTSNKMLKRLSGEIMTSGVDWDVVLRTFNRHYDELLAGMRQPTYAQRVAALEKVEAKVQETKRRAARLPIATSEPATQPGQPNVKTRWMIDRLMGTLLPSLGRAQIVADIAIARRDLTLVAAGLAVYKTQNGKYPDTLATLSPAILKTVPRDIFSDKPFLYKSTSQGYLLYSVGENMTDDNATDMAAGGDDIVLKTPK